MRRCGIQMITLTLFNNVLPNIALYVLSGASTIRKLTSILTIYDHVAIVTFNFIVPSIGTRLLENLIKFFGPQEFS